MPALIRPSPGGTPGHSRSMSLPQAWAITLASWAIAADETSSSAAPSARPNPFVIVTSPDLVDSSRRLAPHPEAAARVRRRTASRRGSRPAGEGGGIRLVRPGGRGGLGRVSLPVALDPGRPPAVVDPVPRNPDRRHVGLLDVVAGLPDPP